MQALADGRARLVVSRARADAAGALLALALDREDKELARKACVDLLKLDPGEAPAPPAFGPGGPGGPGGAPDSAAMDAGAVRSLLEKLGARSEPVSGGGTP
ncbi:MAG TPA: hypothetical protein DEB06_11145 [Phycisphaerales bacterium]|nr:hypothetical protein [Phycisphaerales bacterium]